MMPAVSLERVAAPTKKPTIAAPRHVVPSSLNAIMTAAAPNARTPISLYAIDPVIVTQGTASINAAAPVPVGVFVRAATVLPTAAAASRG